MAFYDEVQADDPYAYWRFRETSGALIDSEGRTSGYTSYTGMTRNVSTINDTGFSFSSSAAACSNNTNAGLRNSNVFSNNRATYEAVLRVDGGISGNGTIFRQGDSGEGYWLRILNGGGVGATVWNVTSEIATDPLTVGEWYHIAFVFDETETRVYINGELTQTEPHAGSWSAIVSSIKNLGMFRLTPITLEPLRNTTLDEVVIYRSTLSEERIQAHADALGLYIPTEINISIDSDPLTATTQLEDADVLAGSDVVVELPDATALAELRDADVISGLGADVSADTATMAAELHNAELGLGTNIEATRPQLTAQLNNVDVVAVKEIEVYFDTATAGAALPDDEDLMVTAVINPGLSPQIAVDNPSFWLGFDEVSGDYVNKGSRTLGTQAQSGTHTRNLVADNINPATNNRYADINGSLYFATGFWFTGSTARSFTVEALIRFNETSSFNMNFLRFWTNSIDYSEEGPSLSMVANNAGIRARWDGVGVAGTAVPVALNEFHHYVVVFTSNGSSLAYTIYINGTIAQSGTTTNKGAMEIRGTRLFIGTALDISYDEIALYEKALTEEDVTRHYETLAGAVVEGVTIESELLTAFTSDLNDVTVSSYADYLAAVDTITAVSEILGVEVTAENPNAEIEVEALTASILMQPAFESVTPVYDTLISSYSPTNYWKLNEDPGATHLNDKTGAHHLQLSPTLQAGSPVFGVFGATGQKGLDLSGSSANLSSITINTIEFWIKKVGAYNTPNMADTYLISGGKSAVKRYPYLDEWFFGGLAISSSGNFRYIRYNQNSLTPQTITFGPAPQDSAWHQIVFQTRTSPSNLTEFYLDGQKLYSGTVHVDLLPETNKMLNGVYGSYWDGDTSRSGFQRTTGVAYDEIIRHSRWLTSSEIHQNYTAGRGVAYANLYATPMEAEAELHIGDTTVTVEPETIKATTRMRVPSILINGGPRITVDTEPAEAQMEPITLTRVAHRSVDVQVAKATAELGWVTTRRYLSSNAFKIIKASDTALTASDAEALDEIDLGGVLNTEKKILGFKVGNTSTQATGFELSFTSNNNILDYIKLSRDKVNWYGGIIIDTMAPNTVSDVLWIKVEPPQSAKEGTATILLNVEQLDVSSSN